MQGVAMKNQVPESNIRELTRELFSPDLTEEGLQKQLYDLGFKVNNHSTEMYMTRKALNKLQNYIADLNKTICSDQDPVNAIINDPRGYNLWGYFATFFDLTKEYPDEPKYELIRTSGERAFQLAGSYTPKVPGSAYLRVPDTVSDLCKGIREKAANPDFPE